MYIGKVDSQAKGFTLIEVLVAMVIFSLVMTVAVSSYRLSIINLTKQDRSLDLNTFTTIKLINKQIKSLKPFFYTLDNGEKAPFFIGTENTMLFITETPILQDSPLAIAMLYIDKKRIYYCEVTFGSQALTSLKSTIPCEEKIEYLNVENAKFSYLIHKFNPNDFRTQNLLKKWIRSKTRLKKIFIL